MLLGQNGMKDAVRAPGSSVCLHLDRWKAILLSEIFESVMIWGMYSSWQVAFLTLTRVQPSLHTMLCAQDIIPHFEHTHSEKLQSVHKTWGSWLSGRWLVCFGCIWKFVGCNSLGLVGIFVLFFNPSACLFSQLQTLDVKCVLLFSYNTGLCFVPLYYAEEEGFS